MNIAVRDELIVIASAGRTVFYSELAPLTTYEANSKYFGPLIGRELDEINRIEHEQGRPLLSAVVISKEHNLPGTGFFECAKELGHFPGRDQVTFWIHELRRVHSYWNSYGSR
jgi:hypothetical protein